LALRSGVRPPSRVEGVGGMTTAGWAGEQGDQGAGVGVEVGRGVA